MNKLALSKNFASFYCVCVCACIVCAQDETEVEEAIEQMLSAVRTLTSVSSSTLPASAVQKLRDIHQQIETFITGS